MELEGKEAPSLENKLAKEDLASAILALTHYKLTSKEKGSFLKIKLL